MPGWRVLQADEAAGGSVAPCGLRHRIEDVDARSCRYGVNVMLTGPPVWEKTGYFAPFDELSRVCLRVERRKGLC